MKSPIPEKLRRSSITDGESRSNGDVNNLVETSQSHERPLVLRKTSRRASILTLVSTVAALMSITGWRMRMNTPISISHLSKRVLEAMSGSFCEAFSLVFLSEIFDKTFFMAGLLAIKTSRFISFVGSLAALSTMTFLSVGIGQLVHATPFTTLRIPFHKYATVLAFSFFGVNTILAANGTCFRAFWGHKKRTTMVSEDRLDAQNTIPESQYSRDKQQTFWAQAASTFALVFCAEFGDRSMLATIALGAAANPLSIAWGAIAGHGLSTLIAVCGGSYVAKHTSEKYIGYFSGSLFLLFAAATATGLF